MPWQAFIFLFHRLATRGHEYTTLTSNCPIIIINASVIWEQTVNKWWAVKRGYLTPSDSLWKCNVDSSHPIKARPLPPTIRSHFTCYLPRTFTVICLILIVIQGFDCNCSVFIFLISSTLFCRDIANSTTNQAALYGHLIVKTYASLFSSLQYYLTIKMSIYSKSIVS